MKSPEVSIEPLDVEGVWLLQSEEPGDGETVAIIGGIHPDEPAGTEVVNDIKAMAEAGEFRLDKGNVVLMLGNTAILNSLPTDEMYGKHFIDHDLNRCFIDENDPKAHLLPSSETYEYQRSRELLPYLTEVNGNDVQAALDLHMHYEENVPEFIITEEETGVATARRIGAPIVAFGFAESEPGGTDYYLHNRGKEGICHELGYNGAGNLPAAVKLGHESVKRFLVSQGMLEDDGSLQPLHREPEYIRTGQAFKREAPEDYVREGMTTFGALEPGAAIGRSGGEDIVAGEDQVAIFPDNNVRVGQEMILLGQKVTV